MNKFYTQNFFVQWVIAIMMFLLMLVIMVVWLKYANMELAAYLLAFIIIPVFQFLITPFLKLIGVYTYLSPMLLVYSASDKKYDLHNGTSFDYLFVMRKTTPGVKWQQKMLKYYIDGMLEIIKKLENNEIPDSVIIRGSSYFFSERTAKRLGFEISETGSFEKINLIFNYLDLIWMFSLSKGKITFPSLTDIKTAKINGKTLLQNKSTFINLKRFLKSKEEA